MRLQAVAFLLAIALGPFVAMPARGEPPGGAFGFGFTSIDGEPLPLERFAGRAMLVVNTASFCGFTYQYDALKTVSDRYRDRGLVVVGVPSGDFAGQEYGSNAEIKSFCETRFDIDFPLTEKVHVKGPNAHPLFVWFKEELGPQGEPRWNFTKYLVGPDGSVVASWPSTVEPTADEVTAAIEKVLPAS